MPSKPIWQATQTFTRKFWPRVDRCREQQPHALDAARAGPRGFALRGRSFVREPVSEDGTAVIRSRQVARIYLHHDLSGSRKRLGDDFVDWLR
jgi:hypothetical protein